MQSRPNIDAETEWSHCCVLVLLWLKCRMWGPVMMFMCYCCCYYYYGYYYHYHNTVINRTTAVDIWRWWQSLFLKFLSHFVNTVLFKRNHSFQKLNFCWSVAHAISLCRIIRHLIELMRSTMTRMHLLWSAAYRFIHSHFSCCSLNRATTCCSCWTIASCYCYWHDHDAEPRWEW